MDIMEKVVSLCKRRGFIFSGSEIYGGLANTWDVGPLGVELKNNIKAEWWRRFVSSRADMVGVETGIIMNPKVWETTGHVANFTDPLVECKKCHSRFRADQVQEACAHCGAKSAWTEARMFNLLFKTFIGPSEETAAVAYMRPETAQGMFVNFKHILQTARKDLPFGIAQIGKAFRNEITPGNFVFRTREFEQMEVEYFVREKDWKKHFEAWLKDTKTWLKDLGISQKRLHYTEVSEKERAFYSKRTVDVEYDYPFGQKELYGLAYRTDYDLKKHMEATGEDLQYVDTKTNEKFIPHVIEPSFGVERTMLVVLLEAYHEEKARTGEGGEEMRTVLKFPKWLAPVKVAVLPLSKKPELARPAKKIYKELLPLLACEYDETQSIGKRYRRQDEIGTPYCVTVDFDTPKDKAVTVRDRDSMKQKRVKIAKLTEYLTKELA